MVGEHHLQDTDSDRQTPHPDSDAASSTVHDSKAKHDLSAVHAATPKRTL
jgi:hypothetical protein